MPNDNSQAKKLLKDIPHEPGVYMMKDNNGKIMYIGKAKDLRNRVSSYFGKDGGHNYQVKVMIRQIRDIDFIVTSSEEGAKILEANLIKFNQPEYNTDLKDGKTYPYIKITNDEFPCISMTRKLDDGNARYYGPFTSAGSVKHTIDFFVRTFRVRQCKTMNLRGCIKSQIGLCTGPCTDPEGNSDYAERIAIIEGILRGKRKGLVKRLESLMKKRKEELRYEEAAVLRDIIADLKNLRPVQKVSLIPEDEADIAVLVNDPEVSETLHCFLVFKVREGNVISENFFFLEPSNIVLTGEDTCSEPSGCLLADLLYQYYTMSYIPKKVIVNDVPGLDKAEVQKILSSIKDESVSVVTKPRDKTKKLLELAVKNANLKLVSKPTKTLGPRHGSIRDPHEELTLLMEDLDLPNIPYRIECFDISNLQTESAVGSMVAFVDAHPSTDDYRRFRIRTVKGQNDFEMIKEVVKRRYSKNTPPDLILIDGGPIQLEFAQQALDELGILDYNIASLAKKREEVFLPGTEEPLLLPRSRKSLQLLQRVRDEAHRFAITYHRKLRKGRTIRSQLDDIPGLGQKRKRVLLKHFGSLKKLKEASLEDIAQAPGFGPALAKEVYDFLKRN